MFADESVDGADIPVYPSLCIKKRFKRPTPCDFKDIPMISRVVKPLSDRFPTVCHDSVLGESLNFLSDLHVTLSISSDGVRRVGVLESHGKSIDITKWRLGLDSLKLMPQTANSGFVSLAERTCKQLSQYTAKSSESLNITAAMPPASFGEQNSIWSPSFSTSLNPSCLKLIPLPSVSSKTNGKVECENAQTATEILYCQGDSQRKTTAVTSMFDVERHIPGSCEVTTRSDMLCSDGEKGNKELQELTKDLQSLYTDSDDIFHNVEKQSNAEMLKKENVIRQRGNHCHQLEDEDILNEGWKELEKAMKRKTNFLPHCLTRHSTRDTVGQFHGRLLLVGQHAPKCPMLPLEASTDEKHYKWKDGQLVSCVRDPRIEKIKKRLKEAGEQQHKEIDLLPVLFKKGKMVSGDKMENCNISHNFQNSDLAGGDTAASTCYTKDETVKTETVSNDGINTRPEESVLNCARADTSSQELDDSTHQPLIQNSGIEMASDDAVCKDHGFPQPHQNTVTSGISEVCQIPFPDSFTTYINLPQNASEPKELSANNVPCTPSTLNLQNMANAQVPQQTQFCGNSLMNIQGNNPISFAMPSGYFSYDEFLRTVEQNPYQYGPVLQGASGLDSTVYENMSSTSSSCVYVNNLLRNIYGCICEARTVQDYRHLDELLRATLHMVATALSAHTGN